MKQRARAMVCAAGMVGAGGVLVAGLGGLAGCAGGSDGPAAGGAAERDREAPRRGARSEPRAEPEPAADTAARGEPEEARAAADEPEPEPEPEVRTGPFASLDGARPTWWTGEPSHGDDGRVSLIGEAEAGSVREARQAAVRAGLSRLEAVLGEAPTSSVVEKTVAVPLEGGRYGVFVLVTGRAG